MLKLRWSDYFLPDESMDMRTYPTVNVAKYLTEICEPRLMRPPNRNIW